MFEDSLGTAEASRVYDLMRLVREENDGFSQVQVIIEQDSAYIIILFYNYNRTKPAFKRANILPQKTSATIARLKAQRDTPLKIIEEEMVDTYRKQILYPLFDR